MHSAKNSFNVNIDWSLLRDNLILYFPRKDRNLIEAISSGASSSRSVKVVAAIAVNVMAFLCVLEFVNMTLDLFGDRVGVDGLLLQVLIFLIKESVSF